MNDARELRAEIGLFTPQEVAALIDITEQTLALWRMEKRGANYVKLGRNVFHRRVDMIAWVEAQVVKLDDASARAHPADARPTDDGAPAPFDA